MSNYVFHLIGNAHLDPVWLWDWREGLNEGLVTCRTILDLMDENPQMTFVRGEAAIYQHIEQTDLATFKRIQKYVASGRWDVVGGTFVQPDDNLPATETLIRQFIEGVNYFKKRFNKRIRVAWQADSFGHSAGLPEILTAAGITGIALTRPQPELLAISKNAFWWQAPSGARVMAYRPQIGWYGTERNGMKQRLDECLKHAAESDLTNVGVFYGLGDHGGGPSRRQLADIIEWAAAHPDVQLVHSGLHRMFEALQQEVSQKGDKLLPTMKGELNYCLRGCYASVAKFKNLYRRAEASLVQAELTDTVIHRALGKPTADLHDAWRGILFNSFHDILPGSSIERAMEDQIAWLGGVVHQTQRTNLQALNQLAAQIDTQVVSAVDDKPAGVPLLVWNPQSRPYSGLVELEASLDYRPIWAYENRPEELPIQVTGPDGLALPLQQIRTEHSFMPTLPWRKRVLVPLTLPACGWNVVQMAWTEGAKMPQIRRPVTASRVGIDNGFYHVEARKGSKFIRILQQGRSIFAARTGFHVVTMEDLWGSWGPMSSKDEAEAPEINKILQTWVIQDMRITEKGPLRASMWVQFAAGTSRLELTFSLSQDREVVDIAARLFLNERSARVKLVIPLGDQVTYQVPGGKVKRGPSGEVPGGRWLKVDGPAGAIGIATNALYNFSSSRGVLYATVARASRYANDEIIRPHEDVTHPPVDCGELKFKMIMCPGHAVRAMATELEYPPMALLVPAKKGRLPKVGSLLSVEPASVELLAVKPALVGDGIVIRVQESEGKTAPVKLHWGDQAINLGMIKPYTIATWRIVNRAGTIQAVSSNAVEEK